VTAAKARTAPLKGPGDATTLAHGPGSLQQSFTDKIKRRLSHSAEGHTAATLLKLESVCPNCRHVICSSECLAMTTMRWALKSWKMKVHLRWDTLQHFSRAEGSGASNSSNGGLARRGGHTRAYDTNSSSDDEEAADDLLHSSDDSAEGSHVSARVVVGGAERGAREGEEGERGGWREKHSQRKREREGACRWERGAENHKDNETIGVAETTV
jgi:hypothetical protein